MRLLPVRRRATLLCGATIVLIAAAVWGSQTQVGQAVLRVYAPGFASRPDAQTESREPLPKFAFDVLAAPLPWLAPGTVVPNGPPSEWTHLVIKNDVAITSGDTGRRADNLNEMLSNFSLAVVARVTPSREDRAYHMLDRLAMGWCVEIAGSPTVVSSSTFQEQGADLSDLEAIVLAMQEIQCEDNTRVIARSAITTFYEVEYYVAYGDEHIVSRLRYAVLVHPRTGELAAFTWVVPPGDADPPGGRAVRRMPPNLITKFDLRLMPVASGTLGLPSPKDVAIAKLPPLKTVAPIESELATLAYADSFTPETAQQLQSKLWQYIGWK